MPRAGLPDTSLSPGQEIRSRVGIGSGEENKLMAPSTGFAGKDTTGMEPPTHLTEPGPA